MDSHVSILAEHVQVFAEIKFVAQLSDCSMALADVFNCRWREQPVGKTFLAHAGARCRQELKQAGFSKQVEIGSVQVMRVVESITRFSDVSPAIFDAGQTTLIKFGGASGEFLRPQNP